MEKPIRMSPEEAEKHRTDDAAFRKSQQELNNRYQELVERYPDQWIGVHHSMGIVHSDTRAGLRQQLQERNIPRAQTAISLLESNPRILIL
ncbi:MAG: hypothetical protein OXJ90_08675 [Spirochaetaceae bacterium]|nr:hypothetical protein [Spirochaetaceae bacterium]